jgi:hypothetical protein
MVIPRDVFVNFLSPCLPCAFKITTFPFLCHDFISKVTAHERIQRLNPFMDSAFHILVFSFETIALGDKEDNSAVSGCRGGGERLGLRLRLPTAKSSRSDSRLQQNKEAALESTVAINFSQHTTCLLNGPAP